jgi:hypothetical protein
MSSITDTSKTAAVIPTEEQQPRNAYTADAVDRVARLRAEAAAFPDEAEPRALSVDEIRLARRTSVGALEKAALFAEAAPEVSSAVAASPLFRDAIAFEMAYGGMRDEALALARRVDLAILRRKLKAVTAARGLYRIAKGYVTIDAGDLLRTHLAEMKRALVPVPRRKKAAPAESPDPVKAAK